jgi:hypothetical protein
MLYLFKPEIEFSGNPYIQFWFESGMFRWHHILDYYRSTGTLAADSGHVVGKLG